MILHAHNHTNTYTLVNAGSMRFPIMFCIFKRIDGQLESDRHSFQTDWSCDPLSVRVSECLAEEKIGELESA